MIAHLLDMNCPGMLYRCQPCAAPSSACPTSSGISQTSASREIRPEIHSLSGGSNSSSSIRTLTCTRTVSEVRLVEPILSPPPTSPPSPRLPIPSHPNPYIRPPLHPLWYPFSPPLLHLVPPYLLSSPVQWSFPRFGSLRPLAAARPIRLTILGACLLAICSPHCFFNSPSFFPIPTNPPTPTPSLVLSLT